MGAHAPHPSASIRGVSDSQTMGPVSDGLPLAVGACGSERLFVEGPPTAAIGELTIFAVSADLPCGGKVFGGPSDPTGDLMVAPTSTRSRRWSPRPATTVPACRIHRQPGYERKRRRPRGRQHRGTGDGPRASPVGRRFRDERDDSVSFATPTGLHVACGWALVGGFESGLPYGQCGGLYPVFTDSSWEDLDLDSEAGPLPVYAVDRRPGERRRVRQLELLVSVRIVGRDGGGADRVAAVRRGRPGSCGFDGRRRERRGPPRHVLRRRRAADRQIGPAPSTLWAPPNWAVPGRWQLRAIMSLLTLADGSQVYGGAGLFTFDHPEICSPGGSSLGGNLLQQTFLNPHCSTAGSATFSATVGAASITWPVTSVIPPAAVSPPVSTP